MKKWHDQTEDRGLKTFIQHGFIIQSIKFNDSNVTNFVINPLTRTVSISSRVDAGSDQVLFHRHELTPSGQAYFDELCAQAEKALKKANTKPLWQP